MSGWSIGPTSTSPLTNPKIVWSTSLRPGDLAFEGVVEMRREDGWRMKRKPAWRPRRWEPADEGPHVSGDLVVASFIETDSGLGIRYGLDRADGRLLWATEPGPMGSVSETRLARLEGKTWSGRTIVTASGAVLVADLEARIHRAR